MKQIERFISPFIADQFPSIYRDEGPLFIAFVKAYFEWLESQDQILYDSRRLLEYRDIDKTIDVFINEFKKKYMFPIPEDISGDKQLLQKHIKEVYGSKGTERGLKLLFQLLFGDSISVYKPGDDVFRLSDGEWGQNIYLEVSYKPFNSLFVGEFIVGRVSGARAYVERFQTKYINNKNINIFYLTDVEGNFRNDETVLIDQARLPEGTEPAVSAINSPQIIGSATSITGIQTGFGFNLGDELEVRGKGKGCKAVVTQLEERDGTVSFRLLDGGSGYTIDNTEFQITGPVTNVIITSGGSGYDNSDIVILSNGSINAIANVSTNTVGGIVTISLTNGGNGFLNANTVVISVINTSSSPSVGVAAILDAEIAGGGEEANLAIQTLVDTHNLFTSPLKISALGQTTTYIGTANNVTNMIIGQLSYPTANGYGLSSNVEAGFDTLLKDALGFQNYLVGTIGRLKTVNPGSGYTTNLQVKAVDTIISTLKLLDVQHEAGRGESGNGYLGNNAVITALTGFGTDAVGAVKITDSGFGYEPNEFVTLVSLANTQLEGTGTLEVLKQGEGEGRFKSTRGFLNSDKYIHDSFYYQDFSYEVRSSIVFDKYSDLLRKLWHPAGVEKFGRVLISSEVTSATTGYSGRGFVGDGSTNAYSIPGGA